MGIDRCRQARDILIVAENGYVDADVVRADPRQNLQQLIAFEADTFEPARQHGVGDRMGMQHGSDRRVVPIQQAVKQRSEEHTSELESIMRISYDVFSTKKNKV